MIELIWDRGRSGTATAPSGASITVGDGSDFSPDDLLAASAAGCLMRTFLQESGEARVPILSYASASHVEALERSGPAHVVIRCYVVAAEGSSPSEIQGLLRKSVAESPICQMLGAGVTCQADIRCLRGACAS